MPNQLQDPGFSKPAPADAPIHPLLRERWSPRAFSGEPLERDELLTLFEAGRWAPSAFNEQPWSFVLAQCDEGEAFDRILGCLSAGNQVWASRAAVLAIGVARRDLKARPEPNRTAQYDLGQCVAHLTVQASALGIAVHQMAGFDIARTRSVLAIPEGQDPVVAVALGRPGDAASLPDAVRQKDAAPRVRKPLAEFVFSGEWARTAW